ncbi:DUF3084 domain-containing protein [cyanobacterium endosymbiont of Epithemia clementina EcSB]|uniref:DUF3084 domain-containing protein n=1 Tax=cyanobacterium endosymbiont of Epithemia clementina EcSB TaxID=3034674 RepID=UPI002480687F|nr:DUF3084 domain-containing protein [cyanobacterium endosymbiont of Epithemia clementina EcSB]WGT67431.1 DUF3084 domain-containing protein [cyanobacterium endosymbiont of Epithemia clementina EcSB]
MTSAYILIAAILILGGLIAALGDRLGTKVGKARLRLWNLRPKNTAIVVTVLTGTLIAGSTLGILFTFSKSLREGLFRLDEILKQLRTAQADLAKVSQEKQDVAQEFQTAKKLQNLAQRRLKSINDNFEDAKAQLKSVSDQATKLKKDIQTLLKERKELLESKTRLDKQITQLHEQVHARDEELKKGQEKIAVQNRILQQRQTHLQELETRFQSLENQQNQLQTEIEQRDSKIAELDKAINQKDFALKSRESQLNKLESQLEYLRKAVQVLEQYYQTYQELRERQIAIVRGQVLALGAVRIVSPNAVLQVVDELLRRANESAIEAVGSNDVKPSERVVKITKAQVQQLTQQLKEDQNFVVRIISAGNYVEGEKEVRVFADIVVNQKIFNQEETIAMVSIDTSNMTEESIQQRIDILLAATQFRARRAGVVGNIQVEDGRLKTIVNFIEEISAREEGLDEIKAIAAEETYTIGPLKIRLIGTKDGEVILGT